VRLALTSPPISSPGRVGLEKLKATRVIFDLAARGSSAARIAGTREFRAATPQRDRVKSHSA
jgi:hypothetical protein